MNDGVVGALAKGLSREEVTRAWDEAKSNHELLASCDLHNLPWPSAPGETRITCSKCGGWMHVTKALAYRAGARAVVKKLLSEFPSDCLVRELAAMFLGEEG